MSYCTSYAMPAALLPALPRAAQCWQLLAAMQKLMLSAPGQNSLQNPPAGSPPLGFFLFKLFFEGLNANQHGYPYQNLKELQIGF